MSFSLIWKQPDDMVIVVPFREAPAMGLAGGGGGGGFLEMHEVFDFAFDLRKSCNNAIRP